MNHVKDLKNVENIWKNLFRYLAKKRICDELIMLICELLLEYIQVGACIDCVDM